jgi:hypothetical protein
MEPREMFNALSDADKARILDARRDTNTDHDWWDMVYEDFTHQMREIGIGVDKMLFSGFGSQGDGACFTGQVFDWTKFLPTVGHTDPALTTFAARKFTFSAYHGLGRYYHENSVDFGWHMPLPEGYEDGSFLYWHGNGEELHDSVLVANLLKYNEDELAAQFSKAFRDHMRKLYKILEAEYEYLMSDEAVLDSLDNNDLLEDAINEIIEEEYENA